MVKTIKKLAGAQSDNETTQSEGPGGALKTPTYSWTQKAKKKKTSIYEITYAEIVMLAAK